MFQQRARQNLKIPGRRQRLFPLLSFPSFNSLVHHEFKSITRRKIFPSIFFTTIKHLFNYGLTSFLLIIILCRKS